MKVSLAEHSVTIKVPRPPVFQMFSSFGEEDHPGDNGERATVVEREDNLLLVEFMSSDGNRLYRTLEEVILFPPERITFKHLEGPLHSASEEFRLAQVPDGTRLSYRGQIECRMPWLPGIGWLAAGFYVRPRYQGVARRHMARLKEAAEGRRAPGIDNSI
jgi:hypothetical protein